MSAQQLAIHDAIVGVKRVLSRPRHGLIAEDTIAGPTNRGNKLKRKAEHVQQGHLDNPSGPATFKTKITHAGYTRCVQYLNPLRYDVDGDLIEDWGDEDDDDAPDPDEEALIEDENIYNEIKLEELLKPLTSASALPDHPSLSIPYKSNALTEMVKHAESFLHQQQRLLWKMKQILVTLRGDSGWIPLGAVHTPYNDWLLQAGMDEGPDLPGWNHRSSLLTQTPEGSRPPQAVEQGRLEGTANLESNSETISTGRVEKGQPSGESSISNAANAPAGRPTAKNGAQSTGPATDAPQPALPNDTRLARDSRQPSARSPNQSSSTSGLSSHTAATSLPSFDTESGVHPIFYFNQSCIPGHDAFLPSKEADDARAFLISYVSKQEEIVRNAARLHEGLLRAQLMGRTVWTWCRAEGHVGEMSDGEDWYDKDEWGLTEELVKGEDEEEETTSQKKPRRRGEK